MALDPTAKVEFIKDSLIKFFKDSLVAAGPVTFDITLIDPNLNDVTVDKWFVVDFGDMQRGGLSRHTARIFCCTRKDNEGRKLALLSDAAFGALKDETQNDGQRRIQLYDSSTNPWTDVTGIKLVVQRIVDGPEVTGPDRTKYKILSCEFQWVARA